MRPSFPAARFGAKAKPLPHGVPRKGVVFHNSATLRSFLLLAIAAATAHAQGHGQAEIALQGYYSGATSQSITNTSGLAFKFQDFLPGLGYLSGSLEGYGAQNRFQTGDNFLELRGVPWLGRHWSFTAGDYRAPATLVESPFNNFYTPEIAARGVKISAGHDDSGYTFFLGEETLTAGPRVPYRILAPQNVMGASTVRRLARGWHIGARFLQFSSSAQSIADNPFLFAPGRDLRLARTFSVQSLYEPVKGLKFYGEASKPSAAGQRALVSTVAGAAFESPAVTVRANYIRQGVLYFPMVGYFAGDRGGPFAEARYRPWKRLEFYGSASRYRNNLERNDAVTSLSSANVSGGVTATLPWKFFGNAQISTIGITSQAPGEQAIPSHNRQVSATLQRLLGRHSLHFTWRDLKLDLPPVPQRQGSSEVEDILQIRRLSVGGAVRLQQTSGTERRNSLYFRGSANLNSGRVSAFANVEVGNDLANRSIFATNTYNTSVVGLAVRVLRGWNLQAEAFRNRLNMELNPESIFVLESGGVALNGNLAALDQWSLYFRLTKQIHWGGGLPAETMNMLAAADAVALVGTVEGVVTVNMLAGRSLAPGIPVSLDGHRTTTTTADGHYLFRDVAEGQHEVALSATELPAEYDPGQKGATRLLVQPRRTARADFEVLPLAAIEGKVSGPEGAALENILIRLLPGERYTTTAPDGHFAFYNVREGDFTLALDTKSLPENGELTSEAAFPAAVRIGTPLPPVEYSFVLNSKQKPIRKVLDRK
ncbi:MAG: carboxypeptidase-like regulatory domain-containing protein [Acidobacteriia bacterium]|nr:carboxypeptidase-like regulatory domain-containing protein [Terriglobia bacterium]